MVETQVYPNVATGFSDSNAYLRELTLKSMLVLAPKLSQKTLNQSLLKFLAKLQVSPCLDGTAFAETSHRVEMHLPHYEVGIFHAMQHGPECI